MKLFSQVHVVTLFFIISPGLMWLWQRTHLLAGTELGAEPTIGITGAQGRNKAASNGRGIPARIPTRLRISFLNAHNLFDAEDDPGPEDDEFLPMKLKRKKSFEKVCFPSRSAASRLEGVKERKVLSRQSRCRRLNWTDKKYQKKLWQLASLIQKFPRARDEILVLAEVEKKSVVEELARRIGPPRTLAWRTYHLEDRDPRGIESAFLFPLNVAKQTPENPKFLPLLGEDSPSSEKGLIRRPLELDTLLPCLGRTRLITFHLPSQMGSQKHRKRILDLLIDRVRELRGQGKTVVLAGDSNLSRTEFKEWNIRKLLVRSPRDHMSLSPDWESKPTSYEFKGTWHPFDWIFIHSPQPDLKIQFQHQSSDGASDHAAVHALIDCS